MPNMIHTLLVSKLCNLGKTLDLIEYQPKLQTTGMFYCSRTFKGLVNHKLIIFRIITMDSFYSKSCFSAPMNACLISILMVY